VELYGDLRDQFGHFPLQHFWGPLAGIQASQWIANTAILAAQRFRPHFFYVYLPHLDYAAQREGPDSEAALRALGELDLVIDQLCQECRRELGSSTLLLAASEYTITPVNHVTFPNRRLRDAGLLRVQTTEQGEQLDLENSAAWALVDHQFSHVFVNDASAVSRVAELFRGETGIEEVVLGTDLDRYQLNHSRSGEVVLISSPNSWQAYYWWLDDAQAPDFARTVDIHRKPGYDPVELFFDQASRSTPLDATLVRGSHGAPARDPSQQGVLLSSQPAIIQQASYADYQIAELVLGQFA
jgi:predicted AlkP superfamily pyrophosphatase or phosphodiesterase